MNKLLITTLLALTPLTLQAEDRVCTNYEVEKWTHCANQYGLGKPNSCDFTGMKTVRFGNDSGWVYKDVFGGLPSYKCTPRTFTGSTSIGDKRCEVSSVTKTEAIKPSLNCSERMDCNAIDLANIPAGATPSEELIIVDTSTIPQGSGDIGAFRTSCDLLKFEYIDPLVYPNEHGTSHLHAFFGNSSINKDSEVTRLNEVGGSTCDGGVANRSAYWVPALLDMKTGLPLIPKDSLWYYKEGYQGLSGKGFNALPVGLAMIAKEHYWECKGLGTRTDGIQKDCPVGSKLTQTIIFPQCWDGVNLFNKDQSHMTNPVRGSCPTTHPHHIPRITMNVRYYIEYEGQAANLKLSSDHGVDAGTSSHADWINGWNPEISQMFIDNCLNAQKDCKANLLGEGKRLSK